MNPRSQKANFFTRFAIVSAIGVIAVTCIIVSPKIGLTIKQVAFPILLVAAFISNRYVDRALRTSPAVLPTVQAVAARDFRDQNISTRVVWQTQKTFPTAPPSALAVCQVAFVVCFALPAGATTQGSVSSGTAMNPVRVIVVNESSASVQELRVSRRDTDA